MLHYQVEDIIKPINYASIQRYGTEKEKDNYQIHTILKILMVSIKK